ncbi:hypothetical protein [Pontibacter pamirensis]|uniref:hypothetical protein n=1 Tax=Pontibacter pamirensis TaxID=2562824 RepID=UPI001389CDCE|nr:hypothetical protein [Pontibacter pamirensis]
MKIILQGSSKVGEPTITLFICTASFGHELALVRDTVNNFEVGVPVGWRYGVPVDKSVSFIALRQKESGTDVPRETYNINIVHRAETDLDNTYRQFIENIESAEGFKIIEEGDTLINDRSYKYLIETHKNSISKEDMNNYVLFTNNKGKLLILTMVTISPNFQSYKPLFDKIASTLRY